MYWCSYVESFLEKFTISWSIELLDACFFFVHHPHILQLFLTDKQQKHITPNSPSPISAFSSDPLILAQILLTHATLCLHKFSFQFQIQTHSISNTQTYPSKPNRPIHKSPIDTNTSNSKDHSNTFTFQIQTHSAFPSPISKQPSPISTFTKYQLFKS